MKTPAASPVSQIILGHENADFDAVAALLAAHKLYPDATAVLPERQNRNVAAFLALYGNALPFVTRADVQLGRIKHIILVDTQRLPQIKGLSGKASILVIDHHPVQGEPDERTTINGEVLGSVTTLLTEQIQAQNLSLTSLEATLLILGIYEDTGSLSYGGTTARDLRAAAWLVEQAADLDTVRKFLQPPLNDEQQKLFETLLHNPETRLIDGSVVMVASATTDTYVSELASVAQKMRETMDPSALFLLVQMPSALHLVCRATDDTVHVGEVARVFGGGGHDRAAAATLHDFTLETALAQLWDVIPNAVHPTVRVADLMSHGVQTVDANQPINKVIGRLRRIGHEGYPVVEDGRLVGLLARRDADRALEHALDTALVREVMLEGITAVRPEDSITRLEQAMVESGWGQIPVVDPDDRLIGIVTRTDLIKHWTRTHPQNKPKPDGAHLTQKKINTVLGKSAAALVDAIARHAQEHQVTLYLVGGIVRDLLLKRPNLDIDFVVESDAIRFAESWGARWGGRVSSFRPFGTAKWLPDEASAEALGLPLADLPDHIDFATARNEYYEHPTALPTVYHGSIKLDLNRRDFTINTLAVQFSPESARGRILDFYGGLNDLENKRLRVLHSLSFVDDPTRILRAVRFEQRLGFEIEPRTAQLIQTALPMLHRITGERVRNELTLLLREPNAENGLLALQERGALTAIHPAFFVPAEISATFYTLRTRANEIMATHQPPPSLSDLYWHGIAAHLEPDAVTALCERLLWGKTVSESLHATSMLMHGRAALERPGLRPSDVVEQLERVQPLALQVVRLLADKPIAALIERYEQEWKAVRPITDGNALKQRGLPPGPCYALLLGRLRAASLNGEASSVTDENNLIDQWLAEGVCT